MAPPERGGGDRRAGTRDPAAACDGRRWRPRNALFCAGAWSDRLAVMAGAPPDPRIVPFRGAYLRLRPERRGLVRSLIYPVPDPALPFLGVHLTRHTSGEVLVGPTALMAPGRDAYAAPPRPAPRPRAPRCRGPGPGASPAAGGGPARPRSATRQAAAPSWRRRGASSPSSPWPTSSPRSRASARRRWRRDGSLVDDFAFSATDRALHVRNAPVARGHLVLRDRPPRRRRGRGRLRPGG